MKVLIIGSGGREHALAWKAAQSPRVTQVFVAPGNAGTAREPGMRNVDVAADDIPGLLRFALAEKIDLTIVGPEGALVLGVTDEFGAAGLRCFGPSRAAAQLEGSKAYMKEFLRRHSIPTAAYATFTRQSFDASWVRAQRAPLVVKADGLAAGKGVVICAHGRRGGRDGGGDVCGPLRRRGQYDRGRGVPRRRGSELHRAGGREPRAAARNVAGPQAPARRRRRPEHRRHGRLLARAGRHAGGSRSRDARSHVAHRARTRRRRHAVRRFPLRRPDDRRGRQAESARIQLPARRSRDAAHPCAHALGHHGALRCRARRAPVVGDRRLGPARSRRRRAGRGRLSGCDAQGRRDPRPR